MSKKEKADLKCEIHQVHGFLNDKKNKVVATVSWGDEGPKLNIRSCWDKDGLRLGKGITLDRAEVDVLTELLVSARNTGEMQRVTADGKKKAVNFSKIFGEATDIVDKRDAGYTTKDGFIQLRKRPGVKLK